jgi:TonB-linked SusC/RagA family outer membrane protein
MKYSYLLLIILLSPLITFCQVVTGKVMNPENEPIEGVNVGIKGTKQFTSTNEKGLFKITVNNPASVLQFTATNVETLEVELSGRKEITVILLPKVSKLDEVHIIAYGTSTQRYNVGSISKVTAEDIAMQPVSNPLSALQGRVSGLVVTSTSGIPGASVKVQLRGQNSLNPNLNNISPIDNPLFIIDGVPFSPQNANVNQFPSAASPGIGVTFNNAYGGISPFNSINPLDIESIEVLKDADATAIYGSRGGNGVILITTKRGKTGKTKFSLNVRDGISVVGHTMPMMNTKQYLEMRREAFANDGITPNLTLYDPGYAPDLLSFDTTRYTDWKKTFLGNTAYNTDANASISGGTANTQFYLGAGYNRDTYIFPGDYADNRASFNINLHHTSFNKKLVLDFASNYSYDKNNSSGSPNLLTAYTLEPDYPELMDKNGNLIWTYKGVNLDGSYAGFNPFAYLKDKYNIQNNALNSSLQIGYQLMKGLTLRTSLGFNSFNSREYYGNPTSAQNPYNYPVATARFGNNDFNTWIAEPQLEYKNKIDQSFFSILIGSTFQKNSNYKSEMDGSGYINDHLIESISGAPNTTATDSYNEYKYAALFGRINYRWDNKYLINLNARRDGSSRFGPNKQFGNFGSIGVGWLFSEENFLKKNATLISYGKLRASYGITGSDAIPDYQYLSRWAPTNYSYQSNIGYTPQNLSNPDFSWARTKKLEIGLELGLLHDKILFNSSWYRNSSGNQLVTYQLPNQTGFSSVIENWGAVVQNSGVELQIQSTNIKVRKFAWKTSFNITFPKNKLLSFPGIEKSSYSTTYRVGKSLSTQNWFKYAGVNDTTGIFQFLDANGNLTYDPNMPGGGKYNDYYNMGNLDPEFYGGLQNTLSYKGIQLDIFIEFKKQPGVNYLSQIYSYVPGWEFNQPAELLNRWQAIGDKKDFQQFTSQYSQAAIAARNYFLQSSGVYSDASYIRFKTISLSYELPTIFTKKIHVEKILIYATAQNLFTITGYKGNDPETQNFYGVPPLKTISCGIQLNL